MIVKDIINKGIVKKWLESWRGLETKTKAFFLGALTGSLVFALLSLPIILYRIPSADLQTITVFSQDYTYEIEAPEGATFNKVIVRSFNDVIRVLRVFYLSASGMDMPLSDGSTIQTNTSVINIQLNVPLSNMDEVISNATLTNLKTNEQVPGYLMSWGTSAVFQRMSTDLLDVGTDYKLTLNLVSKGLEPVTVEYTFTTAAEHFAPIAVVSTNPADGVTDVSNTTTIEIVADKAISGGWFDIVSIIGEETTPHSFEASSGGTTSMTLTLLEPLPSNATIVVQGGIFELGFASSAEINLNFKTALDK